MGGLLTLHYVNRAFIYPWRTRTRGKTMPLTIMALSTIFNTVNGTFLGADLMELNRPAEWFADPRFVVGLCIFALGMALKRYS